MRGSPRSGKRRSPSGPRPSWWKVDDAVWEQLEPLLLDPPRRLRNAGRKRRGGPKSNGSSCSQTASSTFHHDGRGPLGDRRLPDLGDPLMPTISTPTSGSLHYEFSSRHRYEVVTLSYRVGCRPDLEGRARRARYAHRCMV